MFSIDLLPTSVPSRTAYDLWRKAGLIHVNDVCRTPLSDALPQRPEIGNTFLGVPLLVFQCLFLGVIFRACKATHTAL